MRLKTLCGLPAALAAAALSLPAPPTLAQQAGTFTDTFNRADGSLGNDWSVSGPAVVNGKQVVSGGGTVTSDLTRPSTEQELNGTASTDTPVNADTEQEDVKLRQQANGQFYDFLVDPHSGANAGSDGVFSVSGGTRTFIPGGGFYWTQPPASHVLTYSLTCTGANPTTLTATIKDKTAGTTLGTCTCTDGTAGLQQAGTSGFQTRNTGGAVGIYNFSYSVSGIIPAAQLVVSDSHLYHSPNWTVNGDGSLQTPYPGAVIKGTFNGTTLGFQFAPANLTTIGVPQASYPHLLVSVDDGVWQDVAEPYGGGTDGYAYNGTLAAGAHSFEAVVKALNYYYDSYGGGNQMAVAGLLLDAGAALSAAAHVQPKRALFLGDSITEGVDTRSFAASPAGNDASVTWCRAVAAALGAEPVVRACNGSAWTAGRGRGFPAFPAWYDRIDAASAAPLTGYDYIFLNMGENDWRLSPPASDASVEAAMAPVLAGLRAGAGPSTPIFLMVPFSQHELAAVTDAFSAYEASAHDPKTYLINCGPDAARGIVSSPLNVPNAFSWDSLHPSADDESRLAAALALQVQAALTPAN